jgi:hypothetical protein
MRGIEAVDVRFTFQPLWPCKRLGGPQSSGSECGKKKKRRCFWQTGNVLK